MRERAKWDNEPMLWNVPQYPVFPHEYREMQQKGVGIEVKPPMPLLHCPKCRGKSSLN